MNADHKRNLQEVFRIATNINWDFVESRICGQKSPRIDLSAQLSALAIAVGKAKGTEHQVPCAGQRHGKTDVSGVASEIGKRIVEECYLLGPNEVGYRTAAVLVQEAIDRHRIKP